MLTLCYPKMRLITMQDEYALAYALPGSLSLTSAPFANRQDAGDQYLAHEMRLQRTPALLVTARNWPEELRR